MITVDNGSGYDQMSEIVDSIFERCDDDPACIAAELRKLDSVIRDEILVSDLLNAWQVFWYYFAAYPGDDAVENLLLHSASELFIGVPMGDYGIFSLVFLVTNRDPEIRISDDIQEIARFAGTSAWKDTLHFMEKGD